MAKNYGWLLIAGPTNTQTWSLWRPVPGGGGGGAEPYFWPMEPENEPLEDEIPLETLIFRFHVCRNLPLQGMLFDKFPSCARPMKLLKVQGSTKSGFVYSFYILQWSSILINMFVTSGIMKIIIFINDTLKISLYIHSCRNKCLSFSCGPRGSMFSTCRLRSQSSTSTSASSIPVGHPTSQNEVTWIERVDTSCQHLCEMKLHHNSISFISQVEINTLTDSGLNVKHIHSMWNCCGQVEAEECVESE